MQMIGVCNLARCHHRTHTEYSFILCRASWIVTTLSGNAKNVLFSAAHEMTIWYKFIKRVHASSESPTCSFLSSSHVRNWSICCVNCSIVFRINIFSSSLRLFSIIALPFCLTPSNLSCIPAMSWCILFNVSFSCSGSAERSCMRSSALCSQCWILSTPVT